MSSRRSRPHVWMASLVVFALAGLGCDASSLQQDATATQGEPDGGSSDAELSDADVADTAVADAAVADAAVADAALPDADLPDADLADAALPDAAPPDAQPDAAPAPPPPGRYEGTCDGSGAAWLSGDDFLDINDENQLLLIYRGGASGPPLQQFDVSAMLGMASDDEADLEDVVRSGHRLYVIGSHGRNKNGKLQPNRYRFFALDLAGSPPDVEPTLVGSSSTLLRDMLDAANWTAPDRGIITLLENSSQLDIPNVPDLAPEKHGTNIEGLALLPASSNEPARMVIGFRNPQSSTQALLVTLLNPDDVLTGATAHFGGALLLDLGGLGVRGMTWSEAHHALLILAGSSGPTGAFRIYKWSGNPTAPPVMVAELSAPPSTSPEAIIAFPGSLDVQVLFDGGDVPIGRQICKNAPIAQQFFTDTRVHIAD